MDAEVLEFILGFHWLPWVSSEDSWYSVACANNMDFPYWLKIKKQRFGQFVLLEYGKPLDLIWCYT